MSEPVAWMLRVVAKDGAGSRRGIICGEVFMKEANAHAAATRKSNRWRTVEAFPVWDRPND